MGMAAAAVVAVSAPLGFLQFNDLACEAVGGRVSHFQVFMPSPSRPS